MELQNETDEDKKERNKVETELTRSLRRRARSVGRELNAYLQILHDQDRNLEFDRAVLAIFVVWVPILALLLALMFTAQGQDLLAEFQAGLYSWFAIFLFLAVLDIVATIYASSLIAVWFFPRLANAPKEEWSIIKERELIPSERREAVAWTILPTIISIAAPLATLFASVIEQSGWMATTAVWLFSFASYGGITVFTIDKASRFLRHIIAISRLAFFLGLLGLLAVASTVVAAPSLTGTPTIVVLIAILWLVTAHGFTFWVFHSRYDAAMFSQPHHRAYGSVPWRFDRAKLGRMHRVRKEANYVAVPNVLKRHAIVTILAAIVALFFWLVPASDVWMSESDGRPEPSKFLNRLKEWLAAETPRPVAKLVNPSPLKSAFDRFADRLPKNNPRPSLVLVTAAGGGIRAAYWTGAVLSALQDTAPTLDQHIFAISAVSGGALGAATYKALTLRDQTKCTGAKNNRQCAADFLGGDFVGPSLVAALSGELFRTLARGRGPFLTRDQALQLGWSERWFKVSGGLTPSFGDDFDALFEDHPTPALLLNGTSMVTGRRTVTSNLDLASPIANGNPEGKVCPGEAEVLNPAQHLKLSVSAAVLTSARFPYITPPGLLHLLTKPTSGEECRTWDEIVDGGYVDNEGVITMRDVLNRVIDKTPATANKNSFQTFAEAYRVVVIRLSAQPSPTDPALSKQPPPRDQLNQLYVAFNNQQTASGRDLVREFREQIDKLNGCWIEFNALHDDAPLGWSLSGKSRNRLDAWLDGPTSPKWNKLYASSSSEAAYKRVLGMAQEVNLQQRLDRVRDLVNGKDVDCKFRDTFN